MVGIVEDLQRGKHELPADDLVSHVGVVCQGVWIFVVHVVDESLLGLHDGFTREAVLGERSGHVCNETQIPRAPDYCFYTLDRQGISNKFCLYRVLRLACFGFFSRLINAGQLCYGEAKQNDNCHDH